MNVARWCTVAGVGGATAACGLWLRSLGLFSAAAAMIALRASAVPFGSPPSLGALGSDLPPLPILLTMPLAVVPAMRWEPYAPVVVSAIAAGLAVWWLVGSLRAIGLRTALAIALSAAVAIHPAWLYAAAAGSGSVLAAALLIGGLRMYRRWERSGDALFLLVSAFAIAAAGLARYDMLLVGAGLAVLIFVGPRARPGEPRDERPAFAVAYAAAVAGVLGLWLVVNWSISGDPLAFIRGSFVALHSPPRVPLGAFIVAIPAVIAAVLALALRRATATALATAVVTSTALFASAVSVSPLSLDAVLPLTPLTALLIGEIAADRASVGLALAAPVLVAIGIFALLSSDDWGEAQRALIDVLRGEPVLMWSGERDVAAAVRSDGRSVLIDERVDAVAALLVDQARRVPFERTVRDAGGRPEADLVLARTPTGRGANDRVDAAWPTLYDGGVPWAREVARAPVFGEPAEYRLYAVSPVGRQ